MVCTVTYRPVIKPWPAEWPEVVCAENPTILSADQVIPTAGNRISEVP